MQKLGIEGVAVPQRVAACRCASGGEREIEGGEKKARG
jgi:hypothetical protein